MHALDNCFLRTFQVPKGICFSECSVVNKCMLCFFKVIANVSLPSLETEHKV